MAASDQASGALPPASEGTGVFLSEQSLLILFLEQRLHIGGLCHFLGRFLFGFIKRSAKVQISVRKAFII